VVGYYALLSYSINLPELPAAVIKRLPKYPNIPAALLARLAVHRSYRGLGLGEHLLMDALARSYGTSSEIASFAVVVDAKNEAAIKLYQRYDSIQLPDHPNRPFLPMKHIEKLFS
jgi:ribosomal protein S18 acetylase RimI-like enzyme